MSTRLNTQFNELEKSRKALFDSLQKYPDEVLNKQPAPGKWSVVQVMEHLMASEGASLQYLKKKTLDTSRAQPAGFKGQWRLFITKLIFYSPASFGAPSALEPPATFIPLKQVEADWAKLRGDTFQLLSKLSETELKKELWKHIISGKMNIYQMLEFFGIHFKRHQKQIERTLKQVQS